MFPVFDFQNMDNENIVMNGQEGTHIPRDTE